MHDYSLRKASNSRIPSGVEEDQPVGANQVDTTTTCFTTQQKNHLGSFWVVESIHEFLTFVDVHGSVEPETAILFVTTQLLHEVERRGVVANENNLVVCIFVYMVQESDCKTDCKYTLIGRGLDPRCNQAYLSRTINLPDNEQSMYL